MNRWGIAGLMLTLLAAGCSHTVHEREAALPLTPEPEPVVTTTAPPTTTTSTTPPTTAPPAASPAPPAAPVDGLVRGSSGDAVLALQQRLVELNYDPGTVDGKYGGGTAVAVMAFQKANGMPRTGQATQTVLDALAVATDPAPMLPEGGATRIEVDFARQILLYWRDGELVKILPVSTGNGKRYCEGGACGVAVTPSGSFRIERRIKGLRRSRLGILHNPLYFKGGYAIHGSPSVPAGPASHGCVRVPIHSSAWLFDNVPNGTPVYLIGGKNPAVPFPPPAPAPAAEPAPAPAPEPTTA
jgi:peptidoglycan hydrolase-like protein with peptidoglycan-binding domain